MRRHRCAAARGSSYKLRNRMGLEKGSATEPLDLCLAKVSSLRADIAKVGSSWEAPCPVPACRATTA